MLCCSWFYTGAPTGILKHVELDGVLHPADPEDVAPADSLAVDIDALPLLEMAAKASGDGVANGDTLAVTGTTTNEDVADATQTEARNSGSQDSDN